MLAKAFAAAQRQPLTRMTALRHFARGVGAPMARKQSDNLVPSGFSATDRWTTMLRDEIRDSVDKPKVNLYHKKREPFLKQGYNPNHIPIQSNYLKVRAQKPKLDQWENPEYNWPPIMPRATLYKGKALLSHLESEEREKIKASRDFDIPDYRTGDVARFTMYGSLSEKKEFEYSGLVIRKQAHNSINARCTINFNVEGVNSM